MNWSRRPGSWLLLVIALGCGGWSRAASGEALARSDERDARAGTEATAGLPATKVESRPTTDPAALEFFEKSVRPILTARCQGCHGPVKQKGGLRLDARAAILAGGTTGPAVVPGNPRESLLVDAINYGETYQMPPKSKLPAGEIDTLTEWVRRGAPWGVVGPPANTDPMAAKNAGIPEHLSPEEFRTRAQFWSFQPLHQIVPPTVKTEHAGWARNPIDRFILAALEEHGLSPSPEADQRTLIRRLSFDLTGLPPTPDAVAEFLADAAPGAYERLVDRLLASPRHGERWARHWLDLVRYAETYGHEFDYDIPNAFRYRDYVIRAFNADLPYDRFVVEQIAGDRVDEPRRHPAERYNDSILGCGFYFLGEGTHSPVDIREEEMRRIDNQIDVLSKTFLGLTVACARCHDHKFDPITQEDYYALAGFLRSSRHQQAFIAEPERIGALVRRLRELSGRIVALLSDIKDLLPEPLRGQATALTNTRSDQTEAQRQNADAQGLPPNPSAERVFEDFNQESWDGWFVTGDAFGDCTSRAGDCRLDLSGDAPRLIMIPPGQANSARISARLQGLIRSRTFKIEMRYIHYLAEGTKSRISVVIDGFEKIRDPIYGGLTIVVDASDGPRWLTQDVGMWLGHSAYLEIADGAAIDFGGPTTRIDDGRGSIAIDEIRMSNQPTPAAARPGGAAAPAIAIDLGAAIAALRPAHPALAGRLAAALDKARAIESQIPDPLLALAIAEGTPVNESVHLRGNHKNLGEVVPRRFLQVFGSSASATHDSGSGRDDLARRMVDPAVNPLVPRVLVNRLWKHHFGEGIVKSTDDFGAMGQTPSHPVLLDWLAGALVARGWSQKAMHRLMVTSSTYRMASRPVDAALQVDPANTLLHRMNVRRMEAEAIRDSLLAVSGRLEQIMYGPSVPVHLTSFMEGRGRPDQSGPLDGDGRRSLYLSVRRNFLNPMLLAFDAPVPFSTVGRRNVSNVAAQALTMMNDPLVARQARLWAERALASRSRSDRDRFNRMFLTGFSRPASEPEARAALAYIAGHPSARRDPGNPDPSREATLQAWTDLCHVLVNMKEFIFVE